jgi:predicted transcriptional regulator
MTLMMMRQAIHQPIDETQQQLNVINEGNDAMSALRYL